MILPDLTEIWQLKPGLRLIGNASAALLLGEMERFALSGTGTRVVLSLLDGKRTVAEVLDGARSCVSEPEAFFALTQLASQGLIVRSVAQVEPEVAAFWYGIGLDARRMSDSLRANPVAVQSLAGERLAAWMMESLVQVGIIVDSAAGARVVVTDDYLNPQLSECHREFTEKGVPWFIVKPTGTQPLIGPFFRGDGGPCYECLRCWIARNRPVERYARRLETVGRPAALPTAVIETSARAACNLAALAVARALDASADHPMRGRLIALDCGSMLTASHRVVRRPQCPSCGAPDLMRETGERPIRLQPVPKGYCEDGGFRCMAPGETYARYRHLVSSICGAVTHLHPMPGRHTDLRPVYTSGYLVCPQTDDLRGNPFDKVCAGKGRSSEQSRVSALCEALERYSGVYQGDEARVDATLQEIGPAGIHPNRIMGFSDAQLRDRDSINARAIDRSQSIPLPLDLSERIAWTPGWSLTQGERRFVPLAYCYDEAPSETGAEYCRTGYNGAAAGNCLEEAILQGLLELVERDAVGIWWYNRVVRPAIDTEALGDPYFAMMRVDYEQRGWKHWVLDLTHDLGIPVYVAVALEPSTGDFALGFGCHLQRRLAALRAVTELSQLFHPAVRQRWNVSKLSDATLLFPKPGALNIPEPSVPNPVATDLRQDLEACMQRLNAAGLELVVVDKTRPDIELCVAQVIIPGLVHMWQRNGPERLYRVAHELGWLDHPRTESELTPVALLA